MDHEEPKQLTKDSVNKEIKKIKRRSDHNKTQSKKKTTMVLSSDPQKDKRKKLKKKRFLSGEGLDLYAEGDGERGGSEEEEEEKKTPRKSVWGEEGEHGEETSGEKDSRTPLGKNLKAIHSRKIFQGKRSYSRSLSDTEIPIISRKQSVTITTISSNPNLSNKNITNINLNNFTPQLSFGTETRIKLNVGGKIFETYASTLAKYPNTLLGAMFHPRNRHLLILNSNNEIFFDRDPRVFESILNFYRTGKLIAPNWVSLELLREELRYFSLDIPGDLDHNRISMEMMKLDYNNRLSDASEYKKITRHKLLSEHHASLVKILEKFSKKIEKNSALGKNSCEVSFFSPLHYTDSTPRFIFNVISKNEIRELVVELFKEKNFTIEEGFEYSKTKATNIIGLDDQVTNYNDPKFFSFTVKW